MLLMRGGAEAAFNVRMKLWAISLALRFGIIGAALYYLFTRTEIDRIPVLIGVVAIYFLIFLLESRKTLRS
jgi:multidrug efflux pump subunit AcrB